MFLASPVFLILFVFDKYHKSGYNKCTNIISILITVNSQVGEEMIIIDYSDKRPIYEQIVERFQVLIVNGVLEPDEKLPSVRTLAVELSINPNTIQRAYTELEREGFIYSVKGRGNFVKKDEELFQRRKECLLTEFEKQACACLRQGITRDELLGRVRKAAEGNLEVRV